MNDIMPEPMTSISSQTSRLVGPPDFVTAGQWQAGHAFVATARLYGARIETRELAEDAAFIRMSGLNGLTIVFRYGVVVTLGGEVPGLDAILKPHVLEAADFDETEVANLAVWSGSEDRIGPDGQIILSDNSRERMLLVATVLSRSVILARDETLVSHVFERSAPVVADLRQDGEVRLPIRQVMQLVGNVIAARHRVIGTVQVGERPDLLWDHPELDRLYNRLEAEYEIKERADVLERKFGALGEFSEALLNIVQDKRGLRLEWAIIALIAFEILLNLFDRVMG